MKKFLSILSVLIFTVSSVSCGNRTAVELNESEIAESATEEVTTVLPEPTLQECHKTLRGDDKYQSTLFSLTAECVSNIRAHAKAVVSDRKTSGLIGVPVELTYDEDLTNAVISFTYDRNYLYGAPESNLIMLHYDENADNNYSIIETVLDTENCTVSAEITEDGIYMLADIYKWYGHTGEDNSAYSYKTSKKDFPSNWEKECDTGDIIRLADKDWALENAPEFHVSTPEQLASVVWYVNSGVENNRVYIVFEDDIDLSGYEWHSMGWYSQNDNQYSFTGWIDGQNHTIKGLNIVENEGFISSGFVGYGLGVSMYDINFTDAYVDSRGCTGIAGGEIYYEGIFENVSVSGYITGGDDDYGAVIGREADIKFKDCSADVTANGEPFEYLSYKEKRIADSGDVIAFNVTLDEDNMIISHDNPDGDYMNLCWNIYRDGEKREYTGAYGENINLDVYNNLCFEGDYEIYLTAYINGTYIRVSNIIEYHSDGYDFRWSD